MKNKIEENRIPDYEGGPILRKYFGNGELGEYCFQLITIHHIACDTLVGPNGESCGKPAIGTTEYDLAGELMIKGHCSMAHHNAIKTAVEQELKDQGEGRMTAFGINGWGRSSGNLLFRK